MSKENFSRILLKFRKRIGMKQVDLAHAIDVTQPTIGKLENPKYPTMPKYENLVKLSIALKLNKEEEQELFVNADEARLKSSTEELLVNKAKNNYLKSRIGPFINDDAVVAIFGEQAMIDINNELIEGATKEDRESWAPTIIALIRGLKGAKKS